MSRLRFTAWSAVSITLLGLIVVLIGTLNVESSDFYDFYLAAMDVLHGADAYGIQENGLQGFFNPLWAAFPLVPLTAFDPTSAFQVWRALVLLVLAGAAVPLFRIYDVDFGPGWLAIAGWLFLLPWFVGQNAPLVAAGAFLAIVFAERDRWVLAGAVTPLLAVKPHTVVLLPVVLLAAGRLRFLVGALAGGVVALLTAIIVQPNWLVAWLASDWGQSQAGGGQTWPASSLLNVLDYLDLPVILYGVAIVGACTIVWWRRRDPFLHLAALALGLGTAVAPYLRAGDFPLLLPALLLLPVTWARAVALVAAVIFFVPGTPVPLLWLIPGLVAGALVLWSIREPQLARFPDPRHDSGRRTFDGGRLTLDE